MANITDTKGNRISEPAFNGQRAQAHSSSTQWPRQMEPTASQVRLWQRYISTNAFTSNTRYLKQSVGPPPPPPPAPTPITEISCATLSDALSLLPPFQHRIIKESSQIATDAAIWRAFRSKGRLEIVTDGGLKHHNATFGGKSSYQTERSFFKEPILLMVPQNLRALREANCSVLPLQCLSSSNLSNGGVLNIDANFAG
jgi:hypothetical protein